MDKKVEAKKKLSVLVQKARPGGFKAGRGAALEPPRLAIDTRHTMDWIFPAMDGEQKRLSRMVWPPHEDLDGLLNKRYTGR